MEGTTVEYRWKVKSGEYRWFSDSRRLVRDPDGAPVALVGVSRDITDAKRSEQALRESEGSFRLLAEAVPQIVWATDASGANTFFNHRWVEYTGLTLEQSYGGGWNTPFHPEDRKRAWDAWQDATQRGAPYSLECRLRRADGEYRWWLVRGAPLLGADGVVVKWFGTCTDIHDLKQAEATLRTANAVLADTDQRKTEFLAVLSHELRNPLAPIRNSLLLLDRAPPGSDVARRAKEILHRQTAHLARLVDDLLDVARIAKGKFELQLTRFDARDVVRRACDDVRAAFEERGVALQYRESVEPTWVHADAARVTQMIGNLLNNALKFTPPGGKAFANIRRREGTCEVSVRDTGQGIARTDLERIFDPFVQAEQSLEKKHGGLGIGLALVRDLAAKQGGSVRAESAGPNEGSEFVVELPLAPAPVRAEGETGTERRVPSLSVLIVEDNVDAGETLADLLTLEGHDVRVVTTGRAGIDAALAQAPEVLICDVGLPDLNGYEVIQAVRAASAVRDVYAIALTGYAQPQDRDRAIASGFDAHLSKPPPLEDLETLLLAAAAGRRR